MKSKGEPSGGPSGTVEAVLSPWRANLLQLQKRNRIDELLSDPNPAKRIQQLPLLDVYLAVKQAGVSDAGSLLALTSSEQIQGCLDLDLWDKDALREGRLIDWFAMLLSLGPQKLGQTVTHLDPELVTLLIGRHTRIYDLTQEEEPPSDSPHAIFSTPDNSFAVEITADGEMSELVGRFIDELYRSDLNLARRVLLAARTDLPSNLEEESYRFRNQRLSELGFFERYDALEIYRALEPQQLRKELDATPTLTSSTNPQDAQALPTSFIDPLSRESWLARALSAITERSALDPLTIAFASLGNRLLSADNVDLADGEALRVTLERMVGFVSIGLDLISDHSIENARDLLERPEGALLVPKLFRVGHTVVGKLSRLASTLVKLHAERFDGAMAGFLEALAQTPPMYRPPGPGERMRPFASVEDVRTATRLVEEASSRVAGSN